MSRILIVDDMAVVREPIAMSLRAAGFEVICAADGEEALAKFKMQRPDLILLDMGLPAMDGLDVLRALRADPNGQHTRVICLTANGSRDCVLEAVELGAQDYILKTAFSMTELLAKIRKLLPDPAVIHMAPKKDELEREKGFQFKGTLLRDST